MPKYIVEFYTCKYVIRTSKNAREAHRKERGDTLHKST